VRAARRDIECELLPTSDGGDGFLDCLAGALGARRYSVVVRGPVHSPVAVPYGLRAADGLAIVETALACGIALLDPAHLDPLGASTGGVGEVLAEARQQGARQVLVGLGGSASTDGGAGMARALGYRFLDREGSELPEGGGYLHRLHHIDPSGFDPGWHSISVRVACDVDNRLLGADGAAHVYAPQKGATARDVELLERGLVRAAAVIQRDLGLGVDLLPGAGAAGGLGAGLAAFVGADLRAGAEFVLEQLRYADRLASASAMITGEGRLDGQSLRGKAPVVAGRLARGAGVKSLALVGSTGPGWEAALGDAFDQVLVTAPPELSPAQALGRAAQLLEDTARRVAGQL